jgi:hypothetical protein
LIFDVVGFFLHNLWDEEAKMSKRNSQFKVLAYFVLFPFLLVAGPDYDEYQLRDPDVSLGVYALSKDSVIKDKPGTSIGSFCSFSNFCSKAHPIRYHQFWNTYSQPYTSELILSVTLRC